MGLAVTVSPIFHAQFENFATEERKITHWNKGIFYGREQK